MTEQTQEQAMKEEKTKIVKPKQSKSTEEKTKVEEIKTEAVQEEKKQKKVPKEKIESVKESKKEAKPKVKKYEAVVHSYSLPLSKRHAMYISNYIKHKKIDDAILMLEQVIKLKQAVPFKGEIPHRKGISGSGRYPVKASKHFIYVLKSLKGNSIVNGLDLDKTRIHSSSPNWAHRPAKGGGGKAKRINLIIKAKEFNGGKKNG